VGAFAFKLEREDWTPADPPTRRHSTRPSRTAAPATRSRWGTEGRFRWSALRGGATPSVLARVGAREAPKVSVGLSAPLITPLITAGDQSRSMPNGCRLLSLGDHLQAQQVHPAWMPGLSLFLSRTCAGRRRVLWGCWPLQLRRRQPRRGRERAADGRAHARPRRRAAAADRTDGR
jgi:hypothetical protein